MAISVILAKKNAASALGDEFGGDSNNAGDRPEPPRPNLKKGNWSKSGNNLGNTFGKKKRSEDVESAIENSMIARTTLPHPDLRDRDEVVFKMTPKGDWEERLVIVTAENLIVAFPDTNYQLDHIPLFEVTLVHRVSVSSREQFSRPRKESLNKSKSMLGTLRRVAPSTDNGSIRDSVDIEDSFSSNSDDNIYAFEIHTHSSGFNKGRSYTFGLPSEAKRENWVDFLNQQVSDASMSFANDQFVYRTQLFLSKQYNSTVSQLTVAGLIVGSFIANAVEAETNPEDGTPEAKFFEDLDIALTFIFAIELLINMAAHWMWPFFKNSWNIFDLIVVSSSMISQALQALPGVTELRLLRLLRTFRVLRLFGRLKAIRRIIAAIGTSIVPVTNAFVIVFLVMALFAIMGVSLFKEDSPQHFGKFSLALLTMFQCSTVEGWVQILEAVSGSTTDYDVLATVFFVMFIAIVVWVLLPVVMAVLLDNFTDEMMRDKEREREKKTAETYFQAVESGTLDPFLQTLEDFESNKNLSYRIKKVFDALDVHNEKMLSFMDFSEGLKAISIGDQIHVSEEDWNHLTQKGKICNPEGKLELEGFETMIRMELNDYLQRILSSNMIKMQGGSTMTSILSSLKLLLLDRNDARPCTAPRGTYLERSRSMREKPRSTLNAMKAVNILMKNGGGEIQEMDAVEEASTPSRGEVRHMDPPPKTDRTNEFVAGSSLNLSQGDIKGAEDGGNPQQPEQKIETLKAALSESTNNEGLSIKQLLISQIHMTKTIEGLRKSVEGFSDNLAIMQEMQRSQAEDISKLKTSQESFFQYMRKTLPHSNAAPATEVGWKESTDENQELAASLGMDTRELEKLMATTND